MKEAYAVSEKQLIFSTDELKEQGLTHYKINQMCKMGELKKLNKQNYENLHFQGDAEDFYYVQAFAAEGVVCMLSAAVFYELTTYCPAAIDVAIPRKSKISTSPDWPKLQAWYFPEERYSAGKRLVKEGNNFYHIYDMEKTVVDIIYYREKIGIAETKEVLHSYLRKPDRDLNRLMTYAQMLKCEGVLRRYLEVLL